MNQDGAVDILLVEDNPVDRELTIRAFSKHKLANRLAIAKDGEEALDFIFCRGDFSDREGGVYPRLVLLDLNLPKVSGLEVLAAIKADPRTRMIPVVVLTTSKEEFDISESYRLGVNSYIVKPVDFEKFVIAMNELGYYWLLLNEAPLANREPPDAAGSSR
jgi:two-component system, response regulator